MKTCPTCNGEVREVAVAGRRVHFRTVPDLEVPEDVPIPTCSNPDCGEEWLDREGAARVDAALVPAYQEVLASKAEAAITKLREMGASQRGVERALGLSAGYLSKLKSGKETTALLVAALMLLADAPERPPLERLRALWRSSGVRRTLRSEVNAHAETEETSQGIG